MSLPTFRGGIHPEEHKTETEHCAIKVILPEKGLEMIYPMIQHLGAPNTPIVQKSDRVLMGQKLGDSDAYVSSPIFASVSGTVTDIRDTLTPTGITSKAVVVENDALFEEDKALQVPLSYEIPDRETLLKRIREAGIVGLGGAGFPTHVKLSPPPEKRVDTIIINASECEPFLTTDHRVLLEEADRIVHGFDLVLSMFPDAQGIIAIENNKPDAIEKLRAEITVDRVVHKKRMKVVALTTKYPQGAEKQLIYACTGREVPSGGLPADIGCIVNNVDTIIAIDRAIRRSRPIMRKIVTVVGGAVNNPGNYKIRLGMKYGDMMNAIGGFKSKPYKMISGGPMMGVAMYSLDVPVIKTSSALICFTEEEGRLKPESNCIRCGKCVSACPMNLMPLDLNRFVLQGDLESFKGYNGLDCIECGSCSYICPAKRHLAQSIRATRRDLMAKARK